MLSSLVLWSVHSKNTLPNNTEERSGINFQILYDGWSGRKTITNPGHAIYNIPFILGYRSKGNLGLSAFQMSSSTCARMKLRSNHQLLDYRITALWGWGGTKCSTFLDENLQDPADDLRLRWRFNFQQGNSSGTARTTANYHQERKQETKETE